jgi:hypothetical protein
VSLALLAHPSNDRSLDPYRPPLHPSASTFVRHTSSDLAGQLNREWAELATAPATAPALRQWALACPVLTDVSTLDGVLALVARSVPSVRGALLLALVERAQAGDALACRTVLQAMLGKAVRVVAGTVARRDDVRGDREEALARAVAALRQAIATYPVARRPARVAANLALDTVALAQRGHTGSSQFRLTYQEMPVADVGNVGPVAQHHRDVADGCGPADAELLTLLAWAVRHRVVDLDEAQLLLRVYTVDEHGRPTAARTVAEQAGLSWPTLRQRCRRLAQRRRGRGRGRHRTQRPPGHRSAAGGMIRLGCAEDVQGARAPDTQLP